ncbi:MAG: DUF2959 domain-containing protein [Kiritimatiellia bacterium]
MLNTFARLSLLALLLPLAGCRSAYYGTMEKFGVEKRDIMVDRVGDAQTAQEKAREQFVDALESFKAVVKVEAGDLEKTYNTLKSELERSESRAKDVTDRINSVETVARDLFKEWDRELDAYTSDDLRRKSAEQLAATRRQSDQMLAAMRRAESKLEPVLKALRDQVMFLKHNLNARAIGSIRGEVGRIEADVASLVKDMDAAIREASSFISSMQSSGN